MSNKPQNYYMPSYYSRQDATTAARPADPIYSRITGLRSMEGSAPRAEIRQGNVPVGDQLENSVLAKSYDTGTKGLEKMWDTYIVNPEDVQGARDYYEELGMQPGMAPMAALGSTLSGEAYDFYRGAQTDPLNLVGGQYVRGGKAAALALGFLPHHKKVWADVARAKRLGHLDQEIINQDYQNMLAQEAKDGVAIGSTSTAQRNLWDNFAEDQPLGMWDPKKAFGTDKTQASVDAATKLYQENAVMYGHVSDLINGMKSGKPLPGRKDLEAMLGPGMAHIAYGDDALIKLQNLQTMLELEGRELVKQKSHGAGAGGIHAGAGLNTASERSFSGHFFNGFGMDKPAAHYSLDYALPAETVVSSPNIFTAPKVIQLKQNQPELFREFSKAGGAAGPDQSIEKATKDFLAANPGMKLSELGDYLHSQGLSALRSAPGAVTVFPAPQKGGVFVTGRQHTNPKDFDYGADSTLSAIYQAGGAMYRNKD